MFIICLAYCKLDLYKLLLHSYDMMAYHVLMKLNVIKKWNENIRVNYLRYDVNNLWKHRCHIDCCDWKFRYERMASWKYKLVFSRLFSFCKDILIKGERRVNRVFAWLGKNQKSVDKHLYSFSKHIYEIFKGFINMDVWIKSWKALASHCSPSNRLFAKIRF